MKARLSSLLIAGSVVLAGIQAGSPLPAAPQTTVRSHPRSSRTSLERLPETLAARPRPPAQRRPRNLKSCG